MERIAYPRVFSTVAGLTLAVIGLAGFAAVSGFRNPEITSDLLGVYPVNGWANALHLAIGLAGLGLARLLPALFALAAGAFFFILGVWGVLAPNGTLLLGALPATRSVNLLNLLIGVLGLAAFCGYRWNEIRPWAKGLVPRDRRKRTKRHRQKPKPRSDRGTGPRRSASPRKRSR